MRVQPAADLTWLEQRAPCVLNRNARGIEAVDDDGAIAAMVGFQDWTLSSAQMHVAIERPIAIRVLLPAAFHYLFREAGREIAFGVVRASNRRARKLNKHLGFSEVGRLRDGWARGEDLVVLELRRADCRWLVRERL